MRCNADPRITVALAKELGYCTKCNDCGLDNIDDELTEEECELVKEWDDDYKRP